MSPLRSYASETDTAVISRDSPASGIYRSLLTSFLLHVAYEFAKRVTLHNDYAV